MIEIDEKIFASQKEWASLAFEERRNFLERFQQVVLREKEPFAYIISEETGKPLWEARSEVDTTSAKVTASIASYLERCPTREKEAPLGIARTTHRALGVVAVLGPYNFPAHLPNGQIVPALLAGNAVLFKPSELAPRTGAFLAKCFWESGIFRELLQVIQGDGLVGHALVTDTRVKGVFFTGSFETGKKILASLVDHPEKIVALEMGGNNPLVVSEVKEIEKAVEITILSAFLTAGQRCSSARRLIVIENEPFIQKLIEAIPKIRIDKYDGLPEPFMGPLVSEKEREKVLKGYQELLKRGGKPLIEPKGRVGGPFVTPALVDMTGAEPYDEEIFGPVLQLYRVQSIKEAVHLANATKYGLTASLLSDKPQEWNYFYTMIEAGVINWNTPTTGALGIQPFGGLKCSGNGRPGAYYMIDPLVTPIASVTSPNLRVPTPLPPGLLF